MSDAPGLQEPLSTNADVSDPEFRVFSGLNDQFLGLQI